MSYFERSDLPFYYALADTFTFGDHYFQSTFTATNPNRQHLFSGSNGLSAGGGQCMLDDGEPDLSWETMGETLSAAGVSWQVYQQQDNFDDNAFAWFTSFKNAKPGSDLFERGMRKGSDIVSDFAAAVGNDTLPQVSWIIAPTSLSEHAENHPADGEDLSARLLAVLARPENAKVFAKVAFILNYDEGGQFFDHLWPPVPPRAVPGDGASTVSVEGELTKLASDNVPAGHPIGLGFRVPLFLISPWSRGGVVYSEVNDHTSVIKFVEKRFNVRCPNLSPWRRAVTGDLSAGFDFASPDFSPWPVLPDTSANVNTSKVECDSLPPPTLPVNNLMPEQEPGSRPSRPLPYSLAVSTTLAPTPGDNASTFTLTLSLRSEGAAGAPFIAHDRVAPPGAPPPAPRKYTVEAGKALEDSFLLPAGAPYGLSVHGPNGFVRQFAGLGAAPLGIAHLRYDPANLQVVLLLAAGPGAAAAPPLAVNFTVTDNAYGGGVSAVSAGDQPVPLSVDVRASSGWYDLSVAGAGGEAWRFMGRLETGGLSSSDPAMASGRAPTAPPAAGFPVGLEGFPHIYGQHPPTPEWYRTGVRKWSPESRCNSQRQLCKDECWSVMHPAKDEL